MNTTEFLNRMCSALERPANSLTLNDTPLTVPEWDSMRHMAILLVLDRELNAPVNEEELREFSSLGQLADRLKARGLLDD